MKNNQAKTLESLGQSHHETRRVNRLQFMAKDLKDPMRRVQWKELRAKHSNTVNSRNERQRVNQVNTESQGGQRTTESFHSKARRRAKA